MEKWQVVALLLVGVAFMIVAVVLRARFGDRYELKPIDLALLVLPLVFMLLISGKLKMLDAFGVKADFSELFADAARSDIQQQVADSGAPGVDEVVSMLEMAAKGGVQDIPRLVENRTEALVFRLGHGGYYGPAIQQYFQALYASSYLQYVVILDAQGKLFGIYDALDLAVYFRAGQDGAYADFASRLNQPSDSARAWLAQLPGFVAADRAVARDLSKRAVLERMDQLRVDSLPVVDANGEFVGTIERSRLIASLILEVADRVAARTGAAPGAD